MAANPPDASASSAVAAATANVAAYAHGRVPREVRERQVLALAEELFVERGYAGSSMDELARRAGISKPVIYDLVGSKEELFRRLISSAADELNASVAEAVLGADPNDPVAQLRAGSLAYFVFVAEHEGVWGMLSAQSTSVPMAQAELEALRRRQSFQVGSLLAQAAHARGLDVDERHVEALAYMLNGAFEGLSRWWGEHRDVEASQLVDWLTELVMPGLLMLSAPQS